MKTLSPATLVLEALTARVAEHLAVVEQAAAALKVAHDKVTAAHAAHAEAPTGATRRAHAEAHEALAAAKKAHSDAVAAHAAAHAEEEQASLRDIRNRQSEFAAHIRLEKRAAKDPELAQLHASHKSRGVAIEALTVEVEALRKELAIAKAREGALNALVAQRDAKILKLEEEVAASKAALGDRAKEFESARDRIAELEATLARLTAPVAGDKAGAPGEAKPAAETPAAAPKSKAK